MTALTTARTTTRTNSHRSPTDHTRALHRDSDETTHMDSHNTNEPPRPGVFPPAGGGAASLETSIFYWQGYHIAGHRPQTSHTIPQAIRPRTYHSAGHRAAYHGEAVLLATACPSSRLRMILDGVGLSLCCGACMWVCVCEGGPARCARLRINASPYIRLFTSLLKTV